MHLLRANFILLLALIGYFSSPTCAQINLKTGYNFSILSTPGLDRLISSFDQSQSYSSPFSNLRWLHGFETGLRFKGGVHALELTYQGAYRTLKANGVTQSTAEAYNDKLKYAIHGVAIGYQIANEGFGLGIDLQNQWYSVKYDSGQTLTKSKNIQQMRSFKFYLMFTLQGDNSIDMAFQPYMVLPTKYYDLKPLSRILGLEDSQGQDKWIRYGLTLLFYNGAK